MSSRNIAVASFALGLLVSGCATVLQMPFSADPNARPASDKAVFLMTVTAKNVYKPSYQPKLLVVNVEKPVVQGSDDRLNFKMDDLGRTETESPETGNVYLVRMQLDRGEYIIRGLTSLNHSFLINASFFAPLHQKLMVVGPGVYYLGHVDATVRERKGGEFTAGGPIPLIDQSVAGASGGTFDITISDRWETDGPRFLATFPGLKPIAVQKAILAPFDRQVAQKWWATN